MGNKLNTRHKNWRKQKMKVKLAAQSFSRSVSDTNTDGFSGCEATVEFI